MDRTPFAGLTVVAPDESIYEDGASFLATNPRFIDYLLRLGAKTHRHDAHPPLPIPATAPTVAVNTGGFLPASTTFHVGFTLLDADGGETSVSPIATVTTPGAMPAASAAPGVTVASGSGLPIGTFYYAVTRTDGLGGETTLSPTATVSLQTASRITLTGLNALRAGDAYSLVIYKSTGGAFYRVGETIADTWVDDGTPCADCTIEPPTVNTTQAAFLLDIAVPSGAAASATAVRIYASQEASLISPALVAELASGSLTTQMTRTQFSPGSPPPVSLSKGGANRIDPDTELLDWHWKRSVAASGQLPVGEIGDVRLVRSGPAGPRLYAVGSASAAGPAGWTELVMFGPTGPQGIQGPIGDPGPTLHPKGTYALASAYATYDNVDHQGSSYWASAATPAGTYPPLPPWVLVAEKGAQGPRGDVGMRWKGEWDITLGYPLDSLVTYNNALWAAAGSAVAVGIQPGSATVTFRGVEARPLLAFGSGFSDEVLSTEMIPFNNVGVDGQTPGHVFYFDVTGAGSTVIRAAPQPTHPTWDGFGLLYSATDPNTPIASDDQGAGNAMPLITTTLAPGRYFYVLRGWTAGQYGFYHIDLTGSALFSHDVQGYWDRIFVAASAAGGGGGIAGHIIASGATTYLQRAKLAFAGSGVTITDDGVNDRTLITFALTAGHIVASGGTTYPQRSKLSFAGSGVTIADDGANDRTLISFSIPAPASAAPPLSVVYGATTFTPRSKLKFTGTGVSSVVDDPPNDQIVVTLVDTVGSGGGSGASSGASFQWKGAHDPAKTYVDRDMVRTASAGTETLWLASGAPDPGSIPGSGVTQVAPLFRGMTPDAKLTDAWSSAYNVFTSDKITPFRDATPVKVRIFYFDVTTDGYVDIDFRPDPTLIDTYAMMFKEPNLAPGQHIATADDEHGSQYPRFTSGNMSLTAGRYYVLFGRFTIGASPTADLLFDARATGGVLTPVAGFGPGYIAPTGGTWERLITGAQAQSRNDVTVTTPSLASGATSTGAVTLGKTSRLMRVASTKQIRLRLYTTAAKRTADASRPIGTPPTGDHGLIYEQVFTSPLGLDLNPQVWASNMDSPPGDSIYYEIQQMEATSVVTVTFTRTRVEF